MSHIYTDYLFTLYINCRPLPLAELLEQTGAAGNSGDAAAGTPEQILAVMESKGLIQMSLVDGIPYVDLTEYGKEVSVHAADIMTTVMLSKWQQGILQENLLLETA